MRFRIVAIFACVTLLIGAIWWFGFHGVHPALIFNPPPATQTHHPQLDTIESIDIQNVSLRSILDELAAKHGFRYEIDRLGGNVAAGAISLRLQDVTLRALLNHLAREANPNWVAIDAGDHIRITDRRTWFTGKTNYVTRFYPIAPDAALTVSDFYGPEVQEPKFASSAIVAFLEICILPEHWEYAGGSGALMDFPHGVLVTTTPDVHVLIADVITKLLGDAWEDSGQNGTEPILLAANLSCERDAILRKQLATKADFVFENATWDEISQWLAIEYDLTSLLDANSAAIDLRSGKTRFTCDLPQITLQNGLQMLLRKEDLGYEVRDEVIWITDRLPQTFHFQHKLYPVRDVLMLADCQGSELVELVTEMIAPSSWEVVGGEAVCAFAGNYLVVQQTPQVQRQVANLIGQLRADLSPKWLHAPSSAAPSSETSTATRLQQPVTFDLQDASIHELVRQLRHDFGNRVWLQASDADLDLANMNFTMQSRAPSLWQGLESLFQEYPDLGWKVIGETLVVTSWGDAESEMPLRVYSLAPLVRHAANESGAVDARGILEDELVEAIVNTLDPESWAEVGGPGCLRILGDCLVISNTESVQQRVQQCLDALVKSQAADAPNEIPVTEDEKTYEMWVQKLAAPWGGTLTATTRMEAVDEVRRHMQLPLRFVQSAEQVESELLPLDEDDLSLVELGAANVPLLTLLRGILPQSRYAFRDGILWIDVADESLLTEMCVYPLHDLARVDPQITETLVVGIPQWIDRIAWYEQGGYSAVMRVQDSLLVSASADNQRKVRGLLAALRDVVENPQKSGMRHVDLSVGQIDEAAMELLRQPAISPEGLAVLEQLLPTSEMSSLTGLSLLVALQSQRVLPKPRGRKRPKLPIVTTYGPAIAILPARKRFNSLDLQVAVFPVSDLLARFEPVKRSRTPATPWYLPPVDLSGSGKGKVAGALQDAPVESHLIDFLHHLFQYPWEVGRQSGVPEISLVGTNLVVAADLASLWEIERIIQRLRDLLEPNAPMNWGKSYEAMQKLTSFQFEDTPLDEILQEWERQAEFPIRAGDANVAALSETCQGQGNAEDTPLSEAFSRVEFSSPGKQHQLALRPTPEAVLVEIQRQSYQCLRVYDVREMDARYPGLNLGRLNRLIHEVGCGCFGSGAFGLVRPSVTSIRGFISVEAPPAVLMEVAELLEMLRTQPTLLSLLDDEADLEDATRAAWLEQALKQPDDTLERRLAIWLLGEIDDEAVEPLTLLLEQQTSLWEETTSRALVVSVMQRLKRRAAGLVSKLLATSRPETRGVAGRALVDLVANCTNQPVEDFRNLLHVLLSSPAVGRERTVVVAIRAIEQLGRDAAPLVEDLVSLFTVEENALRDNALRKALLHIDPERSMLKQALQDWLSTHALPPEREQDFNLERWLNSGQIRQLPAPLPTPPPAP